MFERSFNVQKLLREVFLGVVSLSKCFGLRILCVLPVALMLFPFGVSWQVKAGTHPRSSLGGLRWEGLFVFPGFA